MPAETVKVSLYLAWTLALASTLGSLFFSEVMLLPPCKLCWYQRICMYPLVAILTVGILRNDRVVSFYALPLSLIGLATALYHNLLYYHWIPESLAPCTEGVSCTSRQIEWLGFMTIPLLALVAFTVMTLLLLWPYINSRKRAVS